MKIIKGQNSLCITAKKYNIKTLFIKKFFPIFIMYYPFFILVEYINNINHYSNNPNMNFLFIIFAISFIFIYNLFILSSNTTIINSLIIESEICQINYFQKYKSKYVEFNIKEVDIKISKGYFYIDPHEIISISLDKDLIINIWPDKLMINSQWRQKISKQLINY